MSRFLAACLLAALLPSAVAAQGFTPREALRRMTVADDLTVSLVASEPAIRQPLSITFDGKGRLWVIQYLQYPTPAGLKPVAVDQYLRTTYDRTPLPPPLGPRGADRITILSDPDETGHYRQSKDFLTGLNLCSGLCLGHGGAFVLQPPYLLFYRFKPGTDDQPAGDPEVLLSGFGTEDAHALANSIQWGPDGWLYGAQGSTVTANVRGCEFQQGIWRYHPLTQRFELFAEGGGNTWGLDFDRHGNAIAGTNWGNAAMLHQVQGGYYVKGFGKHGPLHNPHAYGYFEHVPHSGFKGGHVTCGGIVYQGDGLPARFRDSYIAANLLSNCLYWHQLTPQGSSFTARTAGDFLVANDTWFRPIDCLTGPDGALYVVDWYDKRANHVDPVDNWDRSNGRIYRVQGKDGRPLPRHLDLDKLSSVEAVQLLEHANSWQRGEARRLLAERRDPAVLPLLRRMVRRHKDEVALEALWALHVSGGLDDASASEFLRHDNADVRTWTVRLLGDSNAIRPELRSQLVELARGDPSPTVRSQLACTAKRLPGADGLPIVRALLERSEDVNDPHIPLLLWWAVEDKAISDRRGVLGLLDGPAAWRLPLVRKALLERLGRRYLAEGGGADLAACARLLDTAPGPAETALLVAGMEKALDGRCLDETPPPLRPALARLWQRGPHDLTLTRFALRLGSAEARAHARQAVVDGKRSDAERSGLIEVLGQGGRAENVPVLLRVLREGPSDAVRGAALTALQGFTDPSVGAAVLAAYPTLSTALKARARDQLVNRPRTALALLRLVDEGKIDKKELSLDQCRRLAAYDREPIARLLEKHYGKIGPQPAGARIARQRSIGVMLSRGKGDARRGKALFTQHCASCHTLFGEGGKIGPDLTGADRKNRDFLIVSIVDPSAVIRPEFVAFNATTSDGRFLNGLIVERTPAAVTLLDAKGQRTVLARDKIESLNASPLSLMPEKLLDPLDDQQIVDLFSYVQGDGPK